MFDNKLILVYLCYFLISCSAGGGDKKVTDDLKTNESLDFKFSESELKRLDYFDAVYSMNDLNSDELYVLYNDSIDKLIVKLSHIDKDGISYHIDSLIKAKRSFIQAINTLYYAELDPNPGSEYYKYKQDEINFQIINFYFNLKSFCE